MKNTVGTKNYNGQDWFWPHDFRHYLRDANARQRKLIHNGWLKIGVPVKKTGQKISDRYLEPKKNQLKKAWDIVRKVVAPKELGQPIPESTNEGFADRLTKKMKKHKGTKVKSKKKLKLKGRGVYQDYDGTDEGDLGPTTKKGKTVKAVHTKSGKEIVVVDTPASRKKLKRMGFKVESVNEGIFSSWMVDKAIKIANKMGGDMTGAVKAIEKLKKGLSFDKKVKDALQKANEGSCGYGIDGKVGKEPAGPHLLKKKKKKKNESINESKQGTKIYNEFEILLRDFEKEFLSLSAQAGRVTYKGDEKILRKELKKSIVPLFSMIRSWGRTAQRD